MTDLRTYTDDELVELGYELQREHDELRARRIALRKEQDRRLAEVRVASLLDSLSEDDVRILVDRAGAKVGGKDIG
jgi:hypothetical protein